MFFQQQTPCMMPLVPRNHPAADIARCKPQGSDVDERKLLILCLLCALRQTYTRANVTDQRQQLHI